MRGAKALRVMGVNHKAARLHTVIQICCSGITMIYANDKKNSERTMTRMRAVMCPQFSCRGAI